MEFLLNWLLRSILLALGVGAALWIRSWYIESRSRPAERWTARIGVGMLLLAGVYILAHGRLLAQQERIEADRERYAVFGDPRRTELRRGEVRGWILDCSGEDERALAGYREDGGQVVRSYPLGEAGANLIGGGADAEARDYTVEILFSRALREPRSFRELGELHPAGRDLRLTLCRDPVREAYRQIRQTGRRGALIMQDVRTGAVLAYAATGAPEDPPVGIRHYSPPGSVFKLALAAAWWENGMEDDLDIPCPAEIEVTPRATIANYGRADLGTVRGATGMLIPSCNTAAVWMAARLRDRVGSEPVVEAYRRYGFIPYEQDAPDQPERSFWRTDSDAWQRRMAPAPSRIRISDRTGPAEWAQLAIGQGPVDVTVVGISRFVQAIANDGVMIPPTLEWSRASERPRGERVMRPETARRLQEAMRLTVDRGTGRAAGAAIQGTGWRIGGKTGTAQVAGRPDNGWFAGIVFTPEGEPRYTVVAFLEGGGPGGGLPATIAGRIARIVAQQAPDIGDRG